MSSEYAIWSGYQLDQQFFRDFVAMLYGKDRGDPKIRIARVAAAYLRWKKDLPSRERTNAPEVLLHAADPQGEVTHIFFPLRWIPYKSRRQLNDPSHPDYSAARQPTEKDKAKLERWINYVNGKLGGKHHIEIDKFEFAAMKDLHYSE